jgi:2-amino-4-hydroxy-6-hydroxymethyldihydropteridine diphosphokinase
MIRSAGVPALIALGSNLGDRRLNILRAVEAMRSGMRMVRVSSLYETEPVGAPAGSPPFLNAVAVALHHEGPDQLLDWLMTLESRLGRVRRQRNGPRVIDLDIIAYDTVVRASGRLTLPHPRYREREFVLAPLREIAPWWVDPIEQKRVGSMRGEGVVRKVG